MPPTTRHYLVEAVLGRGSFGTVYRARFEGEHGFTKQVALKVLNPEVLDLEEVARRLRDEARVLAMLRHRAIVGVDRLASLGGRWAVVMDYVEGVDLGRIVQTTAVPLGPALEIVGEVAGALDAALHAPGPAGRPLGVVHRDLKPSNLMLTSWGEVKILDFGGARADLGDREADSQQFVVGSLAYMAPEQLDFRDSPASDIYALGAILYELVTGRRFGRTSQARERHLDKLGPALEAFACCLPERDPEPAYLLSAMLDHDEAARPTARQAELACLELARKLDQERLRTWAEGVVPALLASRETQPADELTGTSLCEESDTHSVLLDALGTPAPAAAQVAQEPSGDRATARDPRPPPESPAPSAPILEPLAAAPPRAAPHGGRWVTVALLVAVLFLSAALAWVQLGPRSEAVPEVKAPPPPIGSHQGTWAEVASPSTSARSPRISTGSHQGTWAEVTSPEPPAVETQPAPFPEVKYTPVASERPVQRPIPPPRPAPPTVQVLASGDAARVRLVSTAASGTLPAALPAGSYTIQADFGDGTLITAGRVELSGGGETTIRCSARFLRCGSQP
jgi:serine/threonine-protein kinase